MFDIKKIIISALLITIVMGCVSQSKQIENNQIRGKKYVLTLSEDGESVFIAGHLDTGIYYNLMRLYEPNRERVKNLIYNSYGGYLNESDRLFRLAKKNDLNTYALRYCKSACAAAFLGGKHRVASHNTKLGFHQYGTSSTGGIQGGMAMRIRGHQYKDLGKFRKQGVTEDFLKKLFGAKYSSMWHPPANQLIKANVVHEYISRSNLPSFDTYQESLYPES